jgi:hypothetical protein
MPQYHASYQRGSYVRVADLGTLRGFAESWKLHHPLQPGMMAYAGECRRVIEADFYFGGDPIYRLEGIEGYWHEACLTACDCHDVDRHRLGNRSAD